LVLLLLLQLVLLLLLQLVLLLLLSAPPQLFLTKLILGLLYLQHTP